MTRSCKARYDNTASKPHSYPRDKKNEANYLIVRGLRDGIHPPAALNTCRSHINRDRRHRKHPNQRHVPPYWSRKSGFSGTARRTCGRCTRANTAKRRNCEFPLCTVTSSAFLKVLQISWGSCESFGANSTDPNFQCGSFEVPMDYHDTSAGTARLAVIKYAATAPKKGTIFVNPCDPPLPSFIPSTDIPYRQVVPASRDSSSFQPPVLVRYSVKTFRVSMTSSPGIPVE